MGEEFVRPLVSEDAVEHCLDASLDETFPASDPIALAQPHTRRELDENGPHSKCATQQCL